MTTTKTSETGTGAKPLPPEIDVHGVTHIGKVREQNADHFLIASFHRAMRVHATSLGSELHTAVASDSRGYLLLVADGVGGLAQAAQGSARATQYVAQFLLDMSEVCLQEGASNAQRLADQLRASVEEAHESLVELGAQGRPGSAATTLTMFIGLWPRAFVIHAGDSRCYRLRRGEFRRLTTDQTMAQAMIEAGAMTPVVANSSPLKHVLWSALGASQLEPQVLAHDLERTDVYLLCSDGLTRHVSDEEIQQHLTRGDDAAECCQRLLDLALERGGEDNITIVIGRARNADALAAQTGESKAAVEAVL